MTPCSRVLFWSACTLMLVLICMSAGCTSSPGPATTTPAATTPAPSAGAGTITIKNFAFTPATLTVKSGTTVTWTNQDGPTHQIASDSGSSVSFSSNPLATGASYQFTFTTPGTYPYHCAIHPSMTGTIVVQS